MKYILRGRVIKSVGKCKRLISTTTKKPISRMAYTKHEGRLWGTTRLSYHLNIHKIPRVPNSKKVGMVLTTCGNGWCIEPSHLILGNAKQRRAIWQKIKTIASSRKSK